MRVRAAVGLARVLEAHALARLRARRRRCTGCRSGGPRTRPSRSRGARARRARCCAPSRADRGWTGSGRRAGSTGSTPGTAGSRRSRARATGRRRSPHGAEDQLDRASDWTASRPRTSVSRRSGQDRRRGDAGERDVHEPDALGLGLREPADRADTTMTIASATAAGCRAPSARAAYQVMRQAEEGEERGGRAEEPERVRPQPRDRLAVDLLGGEHDLVDLEPGRAPTARRRTTTSAAPHATATSSARCASRRAASRTSDRPGAHRQHGVGEEARDRERRPRPPTQRRRASRRAGRSRRARRARRRRRRRW